MVGAKKATLAAAAAAWVIACGGSPSPGTDDPGLGAPGAAADGGGSSGNLGGSGGGAADSGPGSVGGQACATATAQAESLPVSIVFMYDRSDSMNGTKWNSSKQGIKAFFADPKSKGVSASLAFFCGSSCNATSYGTPQVTLSSLPDGQKFASTLDATQLCSGTPTGPALEGALAYAQTVKQAQGGKGTVAIALVTDGEPSNCGKMTSATAAATQGASAGIKTYVIGVGSSLQNLNALAVAGGTAKATLVDTTNPAQLATDFEKAIDVIRASAMSCDFGIPASSSGALDVNKVNVTLTQSGNAATLNYDAQCAGAGWRYDDVNAPTKVELCKASCDAAKNDASSKVELVFGCKTQGGTPK